MTLSLAHWGNTSLLVDDTTQQFKFPHLSCIQGVHCLWYVESRAQFVNGQN